MIKMTPPERIWVFPCAGCTMFAAEIEQVNTDTVEYIRADRIEELEAQLAKATDTLLRIVRGDDDADNWAIHKFACRWTLAELKGDKE